MEYLYTNEGGDTIKYTDEMIKKVIDEERHYRNSAQKQVEKLYDIRREVYNFFNERYDSGDSEITCTVDDVNELLEMIGADKLKSLFTVSGTISFTITDIEAESEDDATNLVIDSISAEYGDVGSIDWDVEITDTSQQ